MFHFYGERPSLAYTYLRGNIVRENWTDGQRTPVTSMDQIPFNNYSINDLVVTAKIIEDALKKPSK